MSLGVAPDLCQCGVVINNPPKKKKNNLGVGNKFVPSDDEENVCLAIGSVLDYVLGIMDWIMHWILLFARWLAAFAVFLFIPFAFISCSFPFSCHVISF